MKGKDVTYGHMFEWLRTALYGTVETVFTAVCNVCTVDSTLTLEQVYIHKPKGDPSF